MRSRSGKTSFQNARARRRAANSAAPAPGRRYRQQTPAERRTGRRARLLDAALEAFGTLGYQATSIEQLCTDASISTRNFYEEFPGREALLIELHDVLNQRAFDAVIRAMASTDPTDVEARATAGVRAYFEVMTSDARWARIALVESVGVSAAVQAARRAALDRFAALIEAEANRLAAIGRASSRDYSLTALGLVGVINELVHTWTSRATRKGFLEDITREAVRFVVAAIEPVAVG
jgi:AcrR family transcriptional regulator